MISRLRPYSKKLGLAEYRSSNMVAVLRALRISTGL